jgi:hypothetical protein
VNSCRDWVKDWKTSYFFDLGMRWAEFNSNLAEWSEKTFGDLRRGPQGPLKHLVKEVQEVLQKPDDLEEYADCIFLTLDAARRAGFTLDQLMLALEKKLVKNKARTWPPIDYTSDEPKEHVKCLEQ